MGKTEDYKDLGRRRKGCHCCEGLFNPSVVDGGKHDSEEVGPWTRWQNNLNADIIIVGQDWGGIKYFREWEGRDEPDGNPTNTHIQRLLQEFGYSIKGPQESQPQVIFMTNLILCLKDGPLQAPIKEEWLANCSKKIFRPLVELVNPRLVITLGKKPSQAVLALFDKLENRKSKPLYRLMDEGPYNLFGSTYLAPVYHCGRKSMNLNKRPLDRHIEDWRAVAQWLKGMGTRGDV